MHLPEINKHAQERERLCYACSNYGFKFREHNPETPGWAYCKKRQKWFPKQGPELPREDPEYLQPAGLRTCRLWE